MHVLPRKVLSVKIEPDIVVQELRVLMHSLHIKKELFNANLSIKYPENNNDIGRTKK